MNIDVTQSAFETAFYHFRVVAEARVKTERPDHILVADVGRKFIRVVVQRAGDELSRSAYCFVEKGTGNVLKPDGFKRPAKGVRSNIFAEDHGLSGITPWGAQYNR